jgi:chemotaxis protein CheC
MAADPAYSDLELSAIQEIANIGTGNAATALSQLVMRPVDIGVPRAELVPLQDAADAIGPAEQEVMAVLTPVRGDLEANMLLAFPAEAAEALGALFGVDVSTDMGASMLQEVGNILTGSYTTAISGMTGMNLEPSPPLVAHDMLASVVDGVLAMSVVESDTVLFLQTAIHVEGTAVGFAFLLVPGEGMVPTLLGALGLG